MQLTFTPNTAFSDHIRSIRASNGALGLDEIHRELSQQLPGGDVSFADVVEEILEQSRSASRQGDATTTAFAGQFELVSELLALKKEGEGEEGKPAGWSAGDAAAPFTADQLALVSRLLELEEEEEVEDDENDDDENDDNDDYSECGEYCYEIDDDFSSVASSESASSVDDDGDEMVPLAFASQFAEIFEQIRLLSNLGEDDGDHGSIAPSDSISCTTGVTRPRTDYEADSESSSVSGISPFDDPRYEILDDDLYE